MPGPTKNLGESLRLSRDERLTALPAQCFRRALWVVREEPSYADAVYVEGYVVFLDTGLEAHHGWVERGGEVIDPAQPEARMAYFPAARRGREDPVPKLRLHPSRLGGAEKRLFNQTWQAVRVFANAGRG
jgi:hypothetical protein